MKEAYTGLDKQYLRIYAGWFLTIGQLSILKEKIDAKSVFDSMEEKDLIDYVSKFNKNMIVN